MKAFPFSWGSRQDVAREDGCKSGGSKNGYVEIYVPKKHAKPGFAQLFEQFSSSSGVIFGQADKNSEIAGQAEKSKFKECKQCSSLIDAMVCSCPICGDGADFDAAQVAGVKRKCVCCRTVCHENCCPMCGEYAEVYEPCHQPELRTWTVSPVWVRTPKGARKVLIPILEGASQLSTCGLDSARSVRSVNSSSSSSTSSSSRKSVGQFEASPITPYSSLRSSSSAPPGFLLRSTPPGRGRTGHDRPETPRPLTARRSDESENFLNPCSLSWMELENGCDTNCPSYGRFGSPPQSL